LEDTFEEILKTLLLLLSVERDLEVVKHLPNKFELAVHDVADEHDNWFHDKLDEAARKLTIVAIGSLSLKLFLGRIKVVVTPKFLHKLADVKFELLSVNARKSGESESPAKESRTESDCAIGWVNLLRLTHIITLVG
jgi:hypothetical protein